MRGVDAYDRDEVPPATDEDPQVDPAASPIHQDIQGVTAQQEAEGETVLLSDDNPFPPTRYAE